MTNLKPNVNQRLYQWHFNLNEHPLSPQQICAGLANFSWQGTNLNRYLSPEQGPLPSALSHYTGEQTANLLLGNGSDELIVALIMALARPERRILITTPTYNMYQIEANLLDVKVHTVPLSDSFNLCGAQMVDMIKNHNIPLVFICSPNNPTGNQLDSGQIISLLQETEAYVVVDEAYYEFSGSTMQAHIHRFRKLIILRTLSKAFAAAGLRIGYSIGSQDVLQRVKETRLPYSLSNVAQFMGAEILWNFQPFLQEAKRVAELRERLQGQLNQLDGVYALPSVTNFMLVRFCQDPSPIRAQLEQKGMATRAVGHMDDRLKNMIRITVGTQQENDALVEAIKSLLN